jgi:tartrate dehydratase alpha subunit/fumarate hydratase class I-like protein
MPLVTRKVIRRSFLINSNMSDTKHVPTVQDSTTTILFEPRRIDFEMSYEYWS